MPQLLLFTSFNLNKTKLKINLLSIRFYPGEPTSPKSKFSENTTEKELNKIEANSKQKIEEFKHTSNMHDYINDNMDNCNTIEEADNVKESISNKIKRDTAKFIEEIREDRDEYINKLHNSTSFTEMYIARQKIKVYRHFREEHQNAGQYTTTLLNYLDKKYNSTIEYVKSNTENTSNNNVNNNEDKDINKSKDNNLSAKDKPSTIDYVLEKKSSEMPDIYEAGGDD